MVPFYFLHAELERVQKVGEPKRFDKKKRPNNESCTDITNLWLYGKDESSQTITVCIRQYRIHFYVSFKCPEMAKSCCTSLILDHTDLVKEVTTVKRYAGMLLDKKHQTADKTNYADTTLTCVVRVQVKNERDVTLLIERIDRLVYQYCADRGAADHEYMSAVKFYESNIDTLTMATRRLGLDACRWCLLDTSWCKVTTTGQYEFVVSGETDPSVLFCTATLEPETTPLPTLPPLVKILSFDIECLSSTNVDTMPDKEQDPIIQISSVISDDALGRQGSGGVFQRHLFTLGGTCSAIDNVCVQTFQHEADMLRAFADHICAEDPDILTGYNIDNFDLPYMFRRFELDNVEPKMGRGSAVSTCKQKNQKQERRYASFFSKTHDTHIGGRIIFDMYTHARKEFVLRSYTLNSVSSHFLAKQKDDVSYKEIPTLFNGDCDSRARLGHYCVKDAELVLELAFVTQTFVHSFERCKVFRTMLQYLVDRGQQVKFYSMLLAWCSERNILIDDVTWRRRLEEKAGRAAANSDKLDTIPAAKRQKGKDGVFRQAAETADEERATATKRGGGGAKTKQPGYEGATVLDPKTGIYQNPVVCLDYASLYPSIMIAYNLCFTTLVLDERHGEDLLCKGEAERSPIGHCFLKRTVKKGVLPSILEMLLDERADVRRRIKGLDENSIEHKLLDGQQSALKIAANSIYGAIGCKVSNLNFVEIPSSVTAYGRQLILHTKRHIEEDEHWRDGVEVVYGDTDSVMVHLTKWDPTRRRVWDCVAIGREMAASVTQSIGRTPIRLQFETVYKPFLLCTKKRYAAGVYSDLERIAAMENKEEALALCRPKMKYKGLQVVRRDNCTFSTRLQELALESLMEEACITTAVERIAGRLRDELKLLFDGRVNMEELVISKEWKKKSDGANAQMHTRLAQRMQSRDANSAPSIGDRVPYVVILNSSSGIQLCDRAEDPDYVLEKGLPLDFMYYADNQVATPVAKLLRVVLGDDRSEQEIKDLFWPADAPRRDSDKRRKPGESVWMKKASIGSRRITDYFDAARQEEPSHAEPGGHDEKHQAGSSSS